MFQLMPDMNGVEEITYGTWFTFIVLFWQGLLLSYLHKMPTSRTPVWASKEPWDDSQGERVLPISVGDLWSVGSLVNARLI